jgi:protein gp37
MIAFNRISVLRASPFSVKNLGSWDKMQLKELEDLGNLNLTDTHWAIAGDTADESFIIARSSVPGGY